MITSINNQKTVKLDKIDKKLLFYLSQDSRKVRKELAKKLNISAPKLNYRIERIININLIEPIVLLNFPLFHFKSYIILTENLSKEQKEKIKKDTSIYSFCETLGKYQFLIHVFTEDLKQYLIEYLAEVNIKIFEIINYIPDNYNPFNVPIKTELEKKTKKQDLDKKDYLLLAHLTKKPLDSILTIHSQTKLDRKTIKEKTKKLLEHNYIQKFRYIVNIFKLGFLAYYVKMELPQILKSTVLEKIHSDIYSGFIYESFNAFIFWYMPPSHKEVIQFMNEIKDLDLRIKIELIQIGEILTLTFLPNKIKEAIKQKSQ
ncbi:MAG: AsnC family transcriptional regulator [Candidatus Woesearchaeota archaeon]|nr:MAG: AsnC family transcriptional regulator [Candidatus Woesearchaeota archaeon]